MNHPTATQWQVAPLVAFHMLMQRLLDPEQRMMMTDEDQIWRAAWVPIAAVVIVGGILAITAYCIAQGYSGFGGEIRRTGTFSLNWEARCV